MSRVLLFRGPPGAGKSTVARILRERMAPAIRVAADDLRYLTYPRQMRSEHFELSELASLDIARRYARGGFHAILDSVYLSSLQVERARQMLAEAGLTLEVYTLRVSLEDCRRRNRARSRFERMDEARLVEVHGIFEWDVGTVLDCDGRLPEEIVDVILTEGPRDEEPARRPQHGTDLLFLRHAQADVDRSVYPQHDAMELSQQGQAQAMNVIDVVQRFDPQRIVTSSLPRAVQTAEIVAQGCPDVSVESDPRWEERTFASIYGVGWDRLRQTLGEELCQRLRQCSDDITLPGEESLEMAQQRVIEAYEELVASPAHRVLVVSHGGPHSWLCCHLLGVPLEGLRQFYIAKTHFSRFHINNAGRLGRVLTLNAADLSFL